MSSQSPADSPNPRARVAALLEQLCAGLVDREASIRLALLAAVAGESIFLLGPPGVGKSLVARRLTHAFSSGRSFEYLMSRFSTPDEIFGPVSIRKLREEDRYERRIEGYLPGSDVIFLDEIWKAGPAIQNALLTVLNERIYRNGDQTVKVAVRAILAASNELPPKGETLSPLWDRFLIRYEMGGIRSARGFLSMITDTRDLYADTIDKELKLSGELLDQWSEEINNIEVPPEVLNVLQVVRQRIEEANQSGGMPVEPLQLYDRRWKKLIRMLRTTAFLNGRRAVDLMDCALMPHALWSQPQQRAFIEELVSDAVRKHGYSLATGLTAIRLEMDALNTDIRGETETVHTVSEERPLLVDEEFHRLQSTDDRFTATRMKASDYARLDEQTAVVVGFTDNDGNIRHRIRAWQGSTPHSIRVELRGTQLEVRAETHLVEREERIRRRPHRLLVEHWSRRLDQIDREIETCVERLKHHEETAFVEMEQNLFVDAAFARIVRTNHDRVARAFEALELQSEKARFRMTRDLD
ncbi:MAG TPA: ATPase [Deltaproteobacteria bacterium]|nr:ATPase [Deltaproteobacteria bacterium]